jgi:hypothetical protein
LESIAKIAQTPTGFVKIVGDYFPVLHLTVAFVSLDKRQQGTKTRRSSEVYIEAIAHIFPVPFAPGFTDAGGQSEKV